MRPIFAAMFALSWVLTACGTGSPTSSSVKDDDSSTTAGNDDLDNAMQSISSDCNCSDTAAAGASLLDDYTVVSQPNLATYTGPNYYAVLPSSDQPLLQAALPTLQALPPGVFAIVRHGAPGMALGSVPASAIPPGTRAIVDMSCYGASSGGGTSQAQVIAQQTGLPVYAGASTVYPSGDVAGGWIKVTPDGSNMPMGNTNINQ